MNVRRSPGPHKLQKKLIAAIVLLAITECLAYATGKLLQRKWCMYGEPEPPAVMEAPDYSEYLRRRDPQVGWPYPDQYGKGPFNAFGARPSPAFPDTTPETSQIALYGDSFTQSPNSDTEAWGNVLAQKSGCRVSNYGQGGYGSDQAFLRFRRDTRDKSLVVVLSHLSENILRNLTRDRDLLIYQRWYALKPRFVLRADGQLELIPMPTLSEEERLRLEGSASPPLLLEHESFCPGGPAGATLLRFPFTLAIIENFGDFRMRAKLARRPSYAEFYERGHPLQGLEITREICKAFAAEAKSRGQFSLVVLLPTKEDLEYFRKRRTWTYANLGEELKSAGVEFLDFGPTLAESSLDKPPSEVFDATGHFRPAIDALLAGAVLARLEESPIWPTLHGR